MNSHLLSLTLTHQQWKDCAHGALYSFILLAVLIPVATCAMQRAGERGMPLVALWAWCLMGEITCVFMMFALLGFISKIPV